MDREKLRFKAIRMLVLCTAFWSLSFPTMKALNLVQEPLIPGASSWFIATLCLVYRFGGAALVMFVICWRSLSRITWLDAWEGFGLGVFAAAGLIFQMDGLAYTSASTSAFLTQFYCLIIPVWVAFRERRWPSPVVWVSCVLVIAGVAALSDINWTELTLGRGERETLLASVIFTGQILWLQRPMFARNNVNNFTLVMFATIALCCLPVAVATTSDWSHWVNAYYSAPAAGLLAILGTICTLGGYVLMNYWQPLVTATQAGLIYCAEPVFASLFALFLPAWFSRVANIGYENELLTMHLLIGGGLITIANVLIQIQPAPPATTVAEAGETGSAPDQ